jgi:hypothetical protein
MNTQTGVSREPVVLDPGKLIRRYLIVCLWFIAGAVYANLTYQWVTIRSADKEFARSMQHAVQVAGVENRPARELRALLLVRAEGLSVPIRGDEILISGGENSLRATLHYEAHINLPILNKTVYRMSFDHDVRFKPPNT